MIENIKNCGYKEPTAIQKQAIPIMLQVVSFNPVCLLNYVSTKFLIVGTSVISLCSYWFRQDGSISSTNNPQLRSTTKARL